MYTGESVLHYISNTYDKGIILLRNVKALLPIRRILKKAENLHFQFIAVVHKVTHYYKSYLRKTEAVYIS